ncbi:hypothetical protein GCM10011297_21100 [Bacterioplanes sanyensis]|uniref:DM13 domain-containing protein n=1 Tax=Bacterioplanes sanyensis TaxID=1249553 RepID=UPI001678EB4B|nr:DM13 domain-containing protein [Bacterioplanes sanyensis]GGY48011.1 hypothetical protein GCM10011297_21100 [Bacterioplanes sanyensis]
MKKLITLLLSHGLVAVFAFAAGIYTLPILIAEAPPSAELWQQREQQVVYRTAFDHQRQDSDWLHRGQGEVLVGRDFVSFQGSLSPGPDYRLYFSPEFVETEADFLRLKERMLNVGDVRSFNGFDVRFNAIDLQRYNSVIVWCESMNQFITSAQYRF